MKMKMKMKMKKNKKDRDRDRGVREAYAWHIIRDTSEERIRWTVVDHSDAVGDV